MDISNKTLGLLLVAAIVVSIGGTIFSLDRLESISTTGYASQTGEGDVNLTIGSTVSIALNDSGIDFGTCTILDNIGRFDSSQTDTAVNNSNCTGGTDGFPTSADYIRIANDGNVPVTINASVSELPIDIYGGVVNTALSLKMANATVGGGCHGTAYTTYASNFTATGSGGAIDLCADLGYASGNDSMFVYAFYWIPRSASSAGDDETAVTFRAEQV